MNNEAFFKLIAGLVIGLPLIGFLTFVFIERQYLIGTAGIISNGEKYGVSIGKSVDTARRIFETNNFEESPYYISSNSIGCLGFVETRPLDKIVFVDKSWRRGTVCVASKEGVVEYIAWRYSFFDP